MKVLIANQEQVTALLPLQECIEVMEAALKMLAGGEALLPLRTMLVLPNGRDLLGLMPSYLGGISTTCDYGGQVSARAEPQTAGQAKQWKI